MSYLDGALLVAGGLLAGGVNAIAGGGSLISFPVLIAIGHPPLTANLTNTVGMIPGYLGGTVAYRRELATLRGHLGVVGVSAAAGAVLGAVLVVSTPSSVFTRVAPWLIVVASVLMAVQGRLARALGGRVGERGTAVVAAAFVIGVYGAYFNAGLGVVILAMMGLVLSVDLQAVNALKGFASFIVSVIAAVLFVFLGDVAWTAALILAVASYLGGVFGGSLARRVKEGPLRMAIVLSGLTVAVIMLV